MPNARTVFGAALALAGLASIAAAVDPCDYSSPGEPLWREISQRYQAGDAETFPYYVFTDGTNICVLTQAFVAGYEGGGSNPIKLVTPSAETIQNSGKLRLVPPEEFLSINKVHVNQVRKNNPVRPGMLNVYVSELGNLTTVDDIGG